MTGDSSDTAILKDKTIKGVKIIAIAFFLIKLSAFIRQVVLARILSPDVFGLMAFCLVTVGFLANSINFRVHEAIIQTGEREEDMLRVGFTVQLVAAISLVFVILIFAPRISQLLQRPLIAVYLRVLCFRILAPVFILPQALLHRKLDYKSIKLPEIADSIVTSVVSVGLALCGFGIWSLICGALSGWIVSVIIICILARGLPKIYFNFDLLMKITKFSLPLYFAFFLNWIFWNADDFMVGKFLGDASLGYYWIAFYLAHHLIDLRQILSTIAFPLFSRLKESSSELAKTFTEFTQITAFVFFLVAALLIPLAHPTLRIIFGEKWIPATIPFMLFIALVSLRSIFAYTADLLIGIAKTKFMLVVSLVRTFLLIALGPFAALQFGITGMAILILFVMSLTWVSLVIYIKKRIAVSYIRMLWKAVLIALVIGCMAFLLKPFITTLFCLIVVMGVCTISYVMLFFVLDRLFILRLKSYIFAPFKM